MSATLSAVAAALPRAERRGDDVEVVGATHDSRQVEAGWLFCCIVGSSTDGHDHAPDAVQRGAAALLVERPLELAVPQIEVPSVRAAAGPAA
ncbi:MAG: Mur ligase domain-containing protein, partial [Nitriliruptor sp.]